MPLQQIAQLEKHLNERHDYLVAELHEIKEDVKEAASRIQKNRDEIAEVRSDLKWIRIITTSVAALVGWLGSHLFGWISGRG